MRIVAMKRKLQGQEIEGYFSRRDLRHMSAYQSKISRSMFDTCSLTGANLNGATIVDTVFVDCSMDGSALLSSVMQNVVFMNCDFSFSSFQGATIRGVTWSDCNLHGCDLDFIESHDAVFKKTNLWSAKTAFNCQFWNSTFDEESCKRFAAMLARVWPNADAKKALIDLSGERTFKAVDRLMKEASDEDAQEPVTDSPIEKGAEEAPTFSLPRQFETP